VSGNTHVAVFKVTSGSVAVSGLTIEDGLAGGGPGGGISNAGTMTLNSSNVFGNFGAAGGGGIVNVGPMTLNSSTVSETMAPGTLGGGGLWNDGGTMTLNASTVFGNSVEDPRDGGGGGGILNSGGTTTINSSTVWNNFVDHGVGGEIFNIGATMTVNSSTVTDNRAGESNGGGIRNGTGGTMTVNSSTVSDNDAVLGGGIDATGPVTLGATIVAGNAASSTGADCLVAPGSVTSEGYNLTDDATCDVTQSTDTVDTDPDLGPLADNGGPTETQLPPASSPAVGVIPPDTTLGGVHVCPRTDQRGVASAAGADCAIGSVEANAVTVTDPGNQTSFVNTPVSLALSAADSQPGTGLNWSATGLPPGLSIDPTTGTVSGTTPITPSTGPVTVSATDGAGYSGSTTFTWTVTNTLQITTTSLPQGTVGQPYSATIQAAGGNPPYLVAYKKGGRPPRPPQQGAHRRAVRRAIRGGHLYGHLPCPGRQIQGGHAAQTRIRHLEHHHLAGLDTTVPDVPG
jgi:hypothetical protein